MSHHIRRAGLAVALGVVAVTLSPTPARGDDEPEPRQVRATSFDRSAFPARPVIDNRLLPWTPGTELVYDGVVVEEGRVRTHRVVIVATDLVKVVDGVSTLVVFDRDVSEGVLQESELAFQAQDRHGTVWSLGEYPEEFEDGEFVGAPNTWLSGVARARAGILMQARPTVGGFAYSQGRAPEIDFADRARVIDKNQEICVPAGRFTGVWVVDEWDALDPAAGHQIKYHAPGVGVVLVEARGGDAQENLSLASVRSLAPGEMDDIRAEALLLDGRAYTHARHVYSGTPPASRLP